MYKYIQICLLLLMATNKIALAIALAAGLLIALYLYNRNKNKCQLGDPGSCQLDKDCNYPNGQCYKDDNGNCGCEIGRAHV